MNRAQRINLAVGIMEIENMVTDLSRQRDALLEACKLVAGSGPLNNGLTDDNTMKVVRAAIAKAEDQA